LHTMGRLTKIRQNIKNYYTRPLTSYAPRVNELLRTVGYALIAQCKAIVQDYATLSLPRGDNGN
jgi:hypothetical protein